MINIAHIDDLEGNYHSAVLQNKKAIEIAPHEVAPHFCLAVLYDQHDMFDEAIEEYQATLELNPYHLKALFNLGNLFAQEGQYKEAIMCYKRALALDADDISAWNNLGAIYEDMNEFARSESIYKRAQSLNPYKAETNFNLARIQLLQHQKNLTEDMRQDIIRRLNFVLSVNPHNKGAERLLAGLMK
jgi:Flp pilus assembly protein TadD